MNFLKDFIKDSSPESILLQLQSKVESLQNANLTTFQLEEAQNQIIRDLTFTLENAQATNLKRNKRSNSECSIKVRKTKTPNPVNFVHKNDVTRPASADQSVISSGLVKPKLIVKPVFNYLKNPKSFGSCVHIVKAAESESNLKTFKLIYSRLISTNYYSTQNDQLKCFSCSLDNKTRLHACLNCVFIGCHYNCNFKNFETLHQKSTNNNKIESSNFENFLKRVNTSHLASHYKSKNHALFVDLHFGNVFCSKCNDYVYHDKFNIDGKFKISDNVKLSKLLNTTIFLPDCELPAKKRKKLTVDDLENQSQPNFHHLEPTITQIAKRKFIIQKSSYIGLRGLVNLGNTCFMNTIIQVLCHTPTLRNFFLSEKYLGQCNHVMGTITDSQDLTAVTNFNNSKFSSTCIICEMSKIFQNFYSGLTSAFCLDRLLYLVWTQAKHMADYEQQDAHEFLVALLDLMHSQLSPRTVTPNRAVWEPPSTMIDRIFTGRLQSDVICKNCGNVSTTVDAFSDINLDITCRKKVDDNESQIPTNLIECLIDYTRAEELGPSCKIKCEKCKSYQESCKQLSINRIPIVICLHFKRLTQDSTDNSERKISNFIKFEEELDVANFMACNIRKPEKCKTKALNGNFNIENDTRFKYSLYSVVTHSGNLQGGHYTCFIKHAGDWFYCDDHVIKKVNTEQVLKTEAYLLFYHKKFLEYS